MPSSRPGRRVMRVGLATTALVITACLDARPARAQRTDNVVLSNGNVVTGEIKGLEAGLMHLSTGGMGTVSVRWYEVRTVDTDKTFQIVFEDETIYFGSLGRSEGDSVLIVAEDTTFVSPTRSVVRLQALRVNFWDRIDGGIDAGLVFVQQNSRKDIRVNLDARYAYRSSLTDLDFETALSRQNDSDDATRIEGLLSHARQFAGGWFYLGFLDGMRNSQLSLDYRFTAGGGIGRLLVETYRASLGIWIGPGIAVERYAAAPATTSVPLVGAVQFAIYSWESLDTDVSGQVLAMPILGESGRWRFGLDADARHEVVDDLYLRLGIRELYDSRPPSADAEQNDLSVTFGVGWSF